MTSIPLRQLNPKGQEPDLAESFSIRELGELMDGNDMLQGLHRHDHYFILALERGKGLHEIDFVPYKVVNHVVYFMRPGQVHQLKLKAGCKGYLLQFKADFFFHKNKNSGQHLRRVGNKNFYRADEEKFKMLQAQLTAVYKEYRERQEGYREVIKANLAIFFIELFRLSSTPIKRVKPYVQERMDELSALLEKHIHTHKQVAQYAEMMHLSPYQLNAITKVCLGKSCSVVINDEIILEAKRQLLAGSCQVNELAWQMGYEDVSYFIRFFKKHTGYSPEAFRKNFR